MRAEVQARVVHQPAHELDAAAAIGIARRAAAAAGVANGDDRLVALALEAHVDWHVRESWPCSIAFLPRLVGRHDDARDLLGRGAHLAHARYDRFDGIRRSELVKPGDPDPNGLGAVR